MGERRQTTAGSGISREEVERERRVFNTQTAILEQVARGDDFDQILARLCILIEEQSPGATCSILAMDREAGVLRTAAGPSLDSEYAAALDGLVPGEGAGSCGTAVIRGEPVIVVDTELDPIWDTFRELARRFKIRSCWSTPIWSPDRDVLGTFAISHAAPATPTDHQLQLLRTSGHLAGLVIQREHTLAAQRAIDLDEQNRQRLESLGALAGGIAHDFNNLLTSILGNLSMAEDHAESKRAREYIAAAGDACEQSKLLTGRFLAFAKGAEPIRRPVDLGALIDDCARVSLAGSNVKLDRDFAATSFWAEGDPSQLFQVFHNLFLNAAQSMAEGGVVRVRAESVTVGTQSPLAMAPGRYIRVEVADSGVGIEPADLSRVFDPYFSTKPGGSGLGLSSVYTIVRAHDGRVEVQSEPDQGACFLLHLPESDAAGVDDTPHNVPGETKGGRVLLMDDEPAVLRVAEQLLKRAGFEVACASDGDEAVEIFDQARKMGERFDAVVLDLTVRGGMGGIEALELIRELDAEVCAIAVSGYSDDAILANPGAHGFRTGVAKPFRATELIGGVQGAIDADIAAKSQAAAS